MELDDVTKQKIWNEILSNQVVVSGKLPSERTLKEIMAEYDFGSYSRCRETMQRLVDEGKVTMRKVNIDGAITNVYTIKNAPK